MLTKFAVENYRGFSKRIEWNLSNPSKYDFNDYAIKDGVVKSGILYGPNGAGKSNFGFALFDIVNHLSQKFKKPDYYRNFVNAGNLQSPVRFEYQFQFGTEIITYFYEKDRIGNLLSERLERNGKLCLENAKGEITTSSEFLIDEAVKKKISISARSISLVAYILTSLPLEESHYLVKLAHFVDNMLWFSSVEGNQFIGFQTVVESIDEYIIKNELTEDYRQFIKDISGQEFNFLQPLPTDKYIMCNINGISIPLVEIESTGTKSISLLYYWLKQINNASFIFIDEFDAFYHFKLALNVCRKLFELNCQVFTSSHNTLLMTNDLLRPDCNFILNHNIIKPLCECTEKELRFGHNIEKLFRGGAFDTI